MSLMPPVGWADVATKDDLRTLEIRFEATMDAKLARLETRITDAMRTQLFALLAAMLTISTLTVAASAAFG